MMLGRGKKKPTRSVRLLKKQSELVKKRIGF